MAASFLMITLLRLPLLQSPFLCAAIYTSPHASVAMADAEMQLQKRALRPQIRRALEALSPARIAQEGFAKKFCPQSPTRL